MVFLNRNSNSGKDVVKRKVCQFVLKIHPFSAEFENEELSAVLVQTLRQRILTSENTEVENMIVEEMLILKCSIYRCLDQINVFCLFSS